MEIFSNYMFWVVLATIVFIFAIIGFLAENSKKKHEKGEKKKKVTEDIKKEAINQNITEGLEGNTLNLNNVPQTEPQKPVDTFSTMPEVPVQNVQENPINTPTTEQPKVNEMPNITEQEAVNEMPNITEQVTTTESPVNASEAPAAVPSADSTQNLPEIDQQVTEEAATLFNNEDDTDVWQV